MKLILRKIAVDNGDKVALSVLWMDKRFMSTDIYLPHTFRSQNGFAVVSRLGYITGISEGFSTIYLPNAEMEYGHLGCIPLEDLPSFLVALTEWSTEFDWDIETSVDFTNTSALDPDLVEREKWPTYGFEDWSIDHPAFKVTWFQSRNEGVLQITHISEGLMWYVQSCPRLEVLRSMDYPDVSPGGHMYIWGSHEHKDFNKIPNTCLGLAESQILREKIIRFLNEDFARSAYCTNQIPLTRQNNNTFNALTLDDYEVIVI